VADTGLSPAPPPPRGRRAARVLAVWFGCGLVPIAPGTAGTLGALPLYWCLRPLGPIAVVAAAVVITAVAIGVSSVVATDLGIEDPQIVCIDEVAGVLFTLAAAPSTWLGLVAGVVLFRIFDSVKPWPARQLEALPLGWGIVMDDVAAGAWGAAVLLAARALRVL
jgi:phosphatidylglycerophosphatase A